MNLFPWTAFLPEGFENGIIQKVLDRRLYGVGQHFTFWRFSRKWKFFGNFHCDFRKCFTKGLFLTENEVFRNFSFDGEFSIFTDSKRFPRFQMLWFIIPNFSPPLLPLYILMNIFLNLFDWLIVYCPFRSAEWKTNQGGVRELDEETPSHTGLGIQAHKYSGQRI